VSDSLLLKNQVETFYKSTTNVKTEFCIDIDNLFEDSETGEMIPIWQWAGYSNKDKAIYKTKQLVEGVDFLLYKNVKRTEGRGGNNKHQYLFSKDSFKQFLMLSNTTRGRQIRLYFIDVEKRYGKEIAQATPFDQVISKVMGAFDEINNQLQTHSFANTINTQAITEHTQEIINHEQRIQKLEKSNINKIRTNPKKHDKEICLKTVNESPYSSCCPCCGEKTSEWEIDHWFHRSNANIDAIWPVCRACNSKLGAGGDDMEGTFRHEMKNKFTAFQEFRKMQNQPKLIQKELF